MGIAMTVGLIIALMAVIYLIRYIISYVVNKGADAVRNKLSDKKNAQKMNDTKKLSDIYK